MAAREIINRTLLEHWRVSRVPINKADTIYQGDMLVWDAAARRAVKATAASAANFIGVSETTNPIETAGSTRFLSDSQSPRANVVQAGLVEMVWGGGATTIYPFDWVTVGSDAQTVTKSGATSSNAVGRIDPAYGEAGKAVADGDLVRMWVFIPTAQYRTCQ